MRDDVDHLTTAPGPNCHLLHLLPYIAASVMQGDDMCSLLWGKCALPCS
eukprot:CAMPEP_0202880680 /NCGR_PEP_ID=MMETSP1391-20130828/35394_1 /ASSEMBLY_ACC=CAM_ASM_000867 /TAXON_ID=1034604 /ORGANISM="Chlamydomonas leiostraca, Strain SAG 11-49" /LENGTH=48 /DNA_ID= /DNA_START= /DNA_END= /DNA_ORIENTATION=